MEIAIIFTFPFLFLKKYRYISTIVISILFLSLLAIGGRAALLGTVLALVIYFFYLKKNISLKIFTKFIVFIVLILFITLYFNFLNIDFFLFDISRTIQATSLNRMTEGRIDVWSLVLQKLQDQWFIGTGPQSYFFYSGRKTDIIHAHNFILQFLGEWGIIGALLFLTLLYHAVKYGIALHLHSRSNKERYHLAAGVGIISLSVTGLFGGIYFFPETSVYLIFCFALWVSHSKT
jgi:O-antigen ligase